MGNDSLVPLIIKGQRYELKKGDIIEKAISIDGAELCAFQNI